MFTDHVRPSRRVRLDQVESLETRQLAAIGGISETAILGDPPAKQGGAQAVTIAGTVRADRPIDTTANALLFDEYAAGVPVVFPITLTPEADGSYSYSLPLSLSTKLRGGDRDGHQYAVAISVQDKTGSATTSTTFTLPAAKTPVAKVAAHFNAVGGRTAH